MSVAYAPTVIAYQPPSPNVSFRRGTSVVLQSSAPAATRQFGYQHALPLARWHGNDLATASAAVAPASASSVASMSSISIPRSMPMPSPLPQVTGLGQASGHGLPDTVLCFGDSLTAGLRGNKGYEYPGILEDLLRREGYNVSVKNTGAWGEDCSKLLLRFPYVLADAASRGRLLFILILGGTNDIIRGGFYCSELLEKLKQLHSMATSAPGSPVVGVCTMPPAQLNGIKDKARQSMNAGLRALCKDPSERKFLVDLAGVDQSLAYDGLHYNTQGYTEFAERALEAMRPFLTRS
eukprot:TRINITY_DN67772_c0_g1_i1.p1 TRINITY_DN67772_c0_g1~~TRINITY_DN67772_c0_g1_i1.p1  ORF type:complete len:294 (+),score=43.83 TRINITY_DN67772_c0_g1_i1:76-957(+)